MRECSFDHVAGKRRDENSFRFEVLRLLDLQENSQSLGVILAVVAVIRGQTEAAYLLRKV